MPSDHWNCYPILKNYSLRVPHSGVYFPLLPLLVSFLVFTGFLYLPRDDPISGFGIASGSNWMETLDGNSCSFPLKNCLIAGCGDTCILVCHIVCHNCRLGQVYGQTCTVCQISLQRDIFLHCYKNDSIGSSHVIYPHLSCYHHRCSLLFHCLGCQDFSGFSSQKLSQIYQQEIPCDNLCFCF